MNWLSFTNPWMLAGLAAVGLPVLIHYLTRPRPRRIAFPPFRFLVEACAGQQTVHRLRTLVLLTLRCLAVAALVLLFARPFIKPGGEAGAAEAGRRVVLVLDASLSMRAVQRGVTLFARAQAEAADVLRTFEPGSEAAIILVGATPHPLLPALSRNVPALHEALVKAQATYEMGDPGAALALAQRLLGSRGTIYVLSDFQESNWEPVRQLPAGLACRLRPVTMGPVENMAITAVRLGPAEPLLGESTEVSCTILNATPHPRQETVRLELSDFTQEARVTVAPFGSANAVFNVTFAREGSFAGTASLPPDDLREDNTRFIAVRVRKALQVLLVSDTDETDRRSGAFFVSRALAPSPQATPGLSLTRRHSQDTNRGMLETADVFVLVAPATLTGEAVEIIGRRVTEGARLIVFLDGPTAPGLVPPALAPPFRLLRAVTSESGDSLVSGQRRLFAESEPADWAGTLFYRHWQNQPLEGRRDEILLSYADGSAALSLTSFGKGSAVFANLPVTPEGGDFLGSPIFPSMLHELLRALRRETGERAVTPGSAWSFEAPTSGEGTVTVTDPEGRPVAAQVVASGRSTRLALPVARLPGAYLMKQTDALVGVGVINVDPRESDTRPMALERLKSGEGAAVSVVRDEEDLLLAGQTRPLWPALTAAAAALFAIEMLLLAVWRRSTPIVVPAPTPEAPQ